MPEWMVLMMWACQLLFLVASGIAVKYDRYDIAAYLVSMAIYFRLILVR